MIEQDNKKECKNCMLWNLKSIEWIGYCTSLEIHTKKDFHCKNYKEKLCSKCKKRTSLHYTIYCEKCYSEI